MTVKGKPKYPEVY